MPSIKPQRGAPARSVHRPLYLPNYNHVLGTVSGIPIHRFITKYDSPTEYIDGRGVLICAAQGRVTT